VLSLTIMSTRNRSRGVALSTTSSGTTCKVTGSFRSPKSPFFTYSAGNYGSGSHYIVNTPESRETMTDVIGARSTHHAVTHDRKVMERQDVSGPVYKYTNVTAPFGVAECSCASAVVLKVGADSLFDHQTVPDGTLVARSRVPSISKKALDGLLEVYELKDLVQLLGSIAAILAEAEFQRRGPRKATYRQIGKDILSEFAGSPSQFLRSLIGVHLGYKFGVAPLAKATNDVMSVLGRIDKTLQRLAKPFVVHGSYTYEKPDKYSTSPAVNPATFGLYTTRMTVSRTTKVTWTESALRQVDMSQLPSLDRLRYQAILDSLGLNPSFKATWNAIPRSFILDWFIPISQFLEQSDAFKASDSWFTTLNTYGSVKTVTSGTVYEQFAPLVAAGTNVQVVGGLEVNSVDFSHTTYTRSALNGPVWAPAQIFVPEPRVPSLGQWATIAEMLLQTSLQKFRVELPTLAGQK
jgi:hypothetical protein